MPPAIVTSLRISSSTETNHVKPSIRPNRGRHICHGLNQVHASILVLRCSKYSPTCGNRANQQRTTRKGRSQASAPKSHEYWCIFRNFFIISWIQLVCLTNRAADGQPNVWRIHWCHISRIQASPYLPQHVALHDFVPWAPETWAIRWDRLRLVVSRMALRAFKSWKSKTTLRPCTTQWLIGYIRYYLVTIILVNVRIYLYLVISCYIG